MPKGGIVARSNGDDSPDLLVKDILRAGAGLSLPSAAELLAEEGPELVKSLLLEQAQVRFDRTPDGTLSFTREGGHTVSRILHVGDMTGRAIEEAMIAYLQTLPNVTLHAGWTAVDLITSSHHSRDPLAIYTPITCHGAYMLDRQENMVHRVLAKATISQRAALARSTATHEPGGRTRGRPGNGLPCRGARHQRRVHPVPPHHVGRSRRE
jgi:L-aspartate oxidase